MTAATLVAGGVWFLLVAPLWTERANRALQLLRSGWRAPHWLPRWGGALVYGGLFFAIRAWSPEVSFVVYPLLTGALIMAVLALELFTIRTASGRIDALSPEHPKLREVKTLTGQSISGVGVALIALASRVFRSSRGQGLLWPGRLDPKQFEDLSLGGGEAV